MLTVSQKVWERISLTLRFFIWMLQGRVKLVAQLNLAEAWKGAGWLGLPDRCARPILRSFDVWGGGEVVPRFAFSLPPICSLRALGKSDE